MAKLEKGDCFLLQNDKSKTVFYIIEVDHASNSSKALSIAVLPSNIQALDYDRDYNTDEKPEEAIMLPSTAYDEIRNLMLDCIEDINQITESGLLEGDFDIKPGALYVDDSGYLHRMTELKPDARGELYWHYDLFRVEPENICDKWTGSIRSSICKESLTPISEETYAKAHARFKELLAEVAQYLARFA